MENLIKVLLKSTCPHCQKEILIEVESPAPVINGVITPGDITAAKEYVVTKLKQLFSDGEIEKESLDSAVEWIQSEDTVFGPKDAESVIDSVKNSK